MRYPHVVNFLHGAFIYKSVGTIRAAKIPVEKKSGEIKKNSGRQEKIKKKHKNRSAVS